MMSIQSFLALVDAYREARGVSDARVSTLIFNDGGRISEIRGGGDVGARRLERAFNWLSAHWPDAATWPTEIERPVVAGGVSSNEGAAA